MRYSTALPPKKDVARGLLLRGSVFIHLDPRVEDVVVPPWLAQQPQLVLQVGLDMPVPIPDLRVDDDGVFGTLTFNRAPFTCSVPWDAVFAVVGEDGKGMVWPESMPSEIRSEVEREAGLAPAPALASDEAPAPAETEGAGEPGPSEDAEAEVVDLAARRPPAATDDGGDDPDGPGGGGPPRSARRPARRRVRELPPYLRVVK